MSYKKWVYKYKYLKSEDEEFSDKMEKYIVQFHEDFKPNKPPEPELKNPPLQGDKIVEELEDEDIESKPEKKGKDLYKELAKEFHPDKGGTDDDFKDLNELYQDENVLGMYVKAEELGLDIEVLDEEELEETFEKTCNSLQEKINHYQTTAAWKWGIAKQEEKEILSFLIEQQANVTRRNK
tara:strand:- start:51 stop:593 length:543 start_codon:yes stop_codon:yes gene_type:complete